MDLFAQQGRTSSRKPTMRAEFTADGDARLVLVYEWDRSKPLAAWLMNNPSIAGRDAGGGAEEATFDPTARRVIHFSEKLGAGSCALLNWCPIVETKPADLWRRLSAGAFTSALKERNLATIAGYADRATWLVAATGEEGLKRDRVAFRHAFDVFRGGKEVLCLGWSTKGAPLHPLARGRLAIRNDIMPAPLDLDQWEGFEA